jgi:hypothetical protein
MWFVAFEAQKATTKFKMILIDGSSRVEIENELDEELSTMYLRTYHATRISIVLVTTGRGIMKMLRLLRCSQTLNVCQHDTMYY